MGSGLTFPDQVAIFFSFSFILHALDLAVFRVIMSTLVAQHRVLSPFASAMLYTIRKFFPDLRILPFFGPFSNYK